jgi:hypothetical protein
MDAYRVEHAVTIPVGQEDGSCCRTPASLAGSSASGRLVAIVSHPAAGDGEQGNFLGERVLASRSGRNSGAGRQCLPCQERARPQDRCERFEMANPTGALWPAAWEFHSARQPVNQRN